MPPVKFASPIGQVGHAVPDPASQETKEECGGSFARQGGVCWMSPLLAESDRGIAGSVNPVSGFAGGFIFV